MIQGSPEYRRAVLAQLLARKKAASRDGQTISNATKVKDESFNSSAQTQQEWGELKIRDFAQTIEQKRHYAEKSFRFMIWYVVITGALIFIMLILSGCGLSIPSWPLSAMASTIVAPMALFGWVLRGLFPSNEEVKS